MRLLVWSAALALLLSACGDGCSCGSSKPGQAAQGSQRGGAEHKAAERTYSQPAEVRSAQVEAMTAKLEPMPESADRDQLAKAAAAIDGTADLGEPIAPERFAGSLPERIEDYRAEGPAQTGNHPAEGGTATVAARRYRAGKSSMSVKVTDTADAPGLRRELAEQLTQLGNAPTGHQKGQLDGAIAGVVAYHEDSHASRAMALINGRFMVEVMVEESPEPDSAWSAIEALDRKLLKR